MPAARKRQQARGEAHGWEILNRLLTSANAVFRTFQPMGVRLLLAYHLRSKADKRRMGSAGAQNPSLCSPQQRFGAYQQLPQVKRFHYVRVSALLEALDDVFARCLGDNKQ